MEPVVREQGARRLRLSLQGACAVLEQELDGKPTTEIALVPDELQWLVVTALPTALAAIRHVRPGSQGGSSA